MSRSFGPLTVSVDGDPRAMVVFERLFERAPPGSVMESVARLHVELRVEDDGVPNSGIPGSRAADFDLGQTRGFLCGHNTFVLLGANRSIRVEREYVTVSMAPQLLEDNAAIEEIALVDLACAMFLAARQFGLWHVHAACVRLADGAGVLVAGQSGSGKSTTTLMLLVAGAQWLADDTVMLRVEHNGVVAYGVPRLFHVTTQTLANLPHLRGSIVADRQSLLGKYCLDPDTAFPGSHYPEPTRISKLLLPRVEGETTSVSVTDGADALGSLIEASAWVTVDGLADVGTHFAALAALCDQATCLRVSLARDLFAEPALLMTHLEGRDGTRFR